MSNLFNFYLFIYLFAYFIYLVRMGSHDNALDGSTQGSYILKRSLALGSSCVVVTVRGLFVISVLFMHHVPLMSQVSMQSQYESRYQSSVVTHFKLA